VFAGENGIIYAITQDGLLYWYRHLGFEDGSASWDVNAQGVAASHVGTGWNFREVFYAGEGLLYAVTDSGAMLWFRHLGYEDGQPSWYVNSQGTFATQVGSGWNFTSVFPDSDGVIYAITQSGALLWYQHTVYADGTSEWYQDAQGYSKILALR